LSRLLLSTNKFRRATRITGAAALAVLLGLTCWFLWGAALAPHLSLSLPLLTILTAALGGALGYWMLSERLRPVEKNPVSRLILKTYEPTLRLFLSRKVTFLALPTIIVLLGLGAWLGLPGVLQ